MLVAAICMNLIFIYYSADLTATMTSQPPAVRIKSFQDVEDQGYKVVSRGAGRLAHTNLKNAPEGSAMQRLYGSDRQGFQLSNHTACNRFVWNPKTGRRQQTFHNHSRK